MRRPLLVASVVFVSLPIALSQACGGGDDDHAGSPTNDAALDDADDTSIPVVDAAATSSLTIAVHRELDAGDAGAIVATMHAADPSDAGLSGLTIALTAGGSDVAVTDLGGGAYRARIAPTIVSGELPIIAGATTPSNEKLGASVTALVLPTVGDTWDQPIAIGGLVDTAGTEDSSTISPDGEWLIVGTYEPIDTLCCVFHCGTGPADGRNSACQTVTGPYAAPERPNMPGADRIASPTRFVQAAQRMCVTSPDGGDFTLDLPDGGNLVPIISANTAYGFHRQADGTFAEPFLIHFLDDGFGGGPFCFSFVSPVSGNRADVVFANRREDDYASSVHHPTATTLTLGSENILGTYECDGGIVDYTAGAIRDLGVPPPTQNAGNTSESAGYLWSDDETLATPTTLAAKLLPDGGAAGWTPLALPSAGDDLRQPVFRNGRFYYYRNVTIASSAWNGGDPSVAASFGAPSVELAGEPVPAGGPITLASGAIFALGQPTFATRPDGTTEMVFVYYKRTATGFDGQIGRVSSR